MIRSQNKSRKGKAFIVEIVFYTLDSLMADHVCVFITCFGKQYSTQWQQKHNNNLKNCVLPIIIIIISSVDKIKCKKKYCKKRPPKTALKL